MEPTAYNFNDLKAKQDDFLKMIRAEANVPASGQSTGPDLSKLFGNRMSAVMQQLAQYTNINELEVHRQSMVDSTKAQRIHQFAKVTNSEMDAKRLQADFKSAMSYIQIA